MSLKKYQTELEKDKYAPIKKKEMNSLALNFSGDSFTRDKVINANLRLAFKATLKTVREGSKNEDELMELVQIANEAICNALIKYKVDKIDFSYFAYVHAINAVKQHLRFDYLVKPRVIKGDWYHANLDSIDLPQQNMGEVYETSGGRNFLELEQEEPLDDPCEDLIAAINELDLKEHKKDIFLYRYNLGGMRVRTYKECTAKFGLTHQRIGQILKEVTDKIQKNPEIFAEIYGIK